MESPLVTVVLPTHNRAALVGRAIASVLAQTYRELELIVVDDGSTDETMAVVSAVVDARVRLLRLDAQRGASFARNRGLDAAAGTLVAFIDSDDAWHEQKLGRQVAALGAASTGAVLCVCSMEVTQGQRRHFVRYRDEEVDGDTARARLVSGTGVGTPCWLARTGAIRAAGGFDESLPRMQDYECALRLAGVGGVAFMSDVLVAAELGPNSLSASADRYARAIDLIIERHRELFERHPAGHSHMVFRAGKYLALEGRHREALSWFARSLRIRPANVRALAGAVLCASGLFALVRRFKYRR
jgi:glycosyltransferase involved in cell wall biosynthesis